jgi:tellurite resistance protein TerB
MSFLNNLKDGLENAKNTITTEVTKYRSKDFLEAIVASCAMVAYADGHVTSEEKQKMIGFMRTSEQLSVFNQNDIIKLFQKYSEKFEFDAGIGTGEVMRVVGKFQGKPEAQLIIRVCCAIGMADGDFDAQEKDCVRTLVVELGLDPNSFDL